MKNMKNFIFIVLVITWCNPAVLTGQQYCKSIVNSAWAALKTDSLSKSLKILQSADSCDYKNELLQERLQLQKSSNSAMKRCKVLRRRRMPFVGPGTAWHSSSKKKQPPLWKKASMPRPGCTTSRRCVWLLLPELFCRFRPAV